MTPSIEDQARAWCVECDVDILTDSISGDRCDWLVFIFPDEAAAARHSAIDRLLDEEHAADAEAAEKMVRVVPLVPARAPQCADPFGCDPSYGCFSDPARCSKRVTGSERAQSDRADAAERFAKQLRARIATLEAELTLAEARKVHDGRAEARQAAAERKPAAGWIEGADGQWRLRAGNILAHVVPGADDGGGAVWRGQVGASNGTDRASFVFSILWERSLAAAMFAAEDALRAIEAEIVGAVNP